MQIEKDREFLLKLADLCEEHKASFGYTTSDDGIHVELDGRKVFCGWFFQDSGPTELRTAAGSNDGVGLLPPGAKDAMRDTTPHMPPATPAEADELAKKAVSEHKQITRWRETAGKTITRVIEYASGAPDVGTVIMFECGSFAALERSDDFEPDLVRREMALDQALSSHEMLSFGLVTREQADELARKEADQQRKNDLAEITRLSGLIENLKRKVGNVQTVNASPASSSPPPSP
jgi:hypothetical protein